MDPFCDLVASVLQKTQECIFWKLDFWNIDDERKGKYRGILQVAYSVIRGGMVRANLDIAKEYVILMIEIYETDRAGLL